MVQEERATPSAEQIDTSLEQIKKILVGDHARKNDKRLEKLDERLTAEVSRLRAEIHQRVQTLEGESRKQREVLLQALRNELEELRREQIARTDAIVAASMETLRAESVSKSQLAAMLAQMARGLVEEDGSQGES